MENTILNDIEVSPPSVVKRAAHEFASALAATAEFRAFETASETFEHDAQAQEAYHAFQSKQQGISIMKKLNAVTPEEQAEFERLRQAFQSQPSVAAYFEAQANLIAVCQAAGDVLSNATGLNFGKSASSSGCC